MTQPLCWKIFAVELIPERFGRLKVVLTVFRRVWLHKVLDIVARQRVNRCNEADCHCGENGERFIHRFTSSAVAVVFEICVLGIYSEGRCLIDAESARDDNFDKSYQAPLNGQLNNQSKSESFLISVIERPRLRSRLLELAIF